MTKKLTTKPVKKTRAVKEAKADYVAVPTHTVINLSPVVIASQIAELPAEAQELAAEFVLMLRRHYADTSLVVEPKTKQTDWAKLAAFGMWKDRPEMEDSVAYVRELRGHRNTLAGAWADRTDITDSGAYSLKLRRSIENREDGNLSD
jgi:hypothetical protein